ASRSAGFRRPRSDSPSPHLTTSRHSSTLSSFCPRAGAGHCVVEIEPFTRRCRSAQGVDHRALLAEWAVGRACGSADAVLSLPKASATTCRWAPFLLPSRDDWLDRTESDTRDRDGVLPRLRDVGAPIEERPQRRRHVAVRTET